MLCVPGNKGVKEDIEILMEEDVYEEIIMLGLRMNKGIDCNIINERFGMNFINKYGQVIDKMKKENLVEYNDNILKLSDEGRNVANYVICQFI